MNALSKARLVRQMVWLGLVALAAGSLVQLAPGAIGHAGSATCGESGWPATAEGAPASLSAGSYHLWHDGAGWHIRVTGGSGRIGGRVVADGALSVTTTSAALRSHLTRRAQSFSFDLAGGARTESLDFKASCATRISFSFGPERPSGSLAPSQTVYLGAKGQAPGLSFVLRRPVTTGVSGRIIIGPTCPVLGTDVTCPPAKTARGTIRIETAARTRGGGGGRFVKTVQSNANGTFTTALAPGLYSLVVARTSADFVTAKPSQVTVERGVVTQVTLVLDTGIR